MVEENEPFVQSLCMSLCAESGVCHCMPVGDRKAWGIFGPCLLTCSDRVSSAPALTRLLSPRTYGYSVSISYLTVEAFMQVLRMWLAYLCLPGKHFTSKPLPKPLFFRQKKRISKKYGARWSWACGSVSSSSPLTSYLHPSSCIPSIHSMSLDTFCCHLLVRVITAILSLSSLLNPEH